MTKSNVNGDVHNLPDILDQKPSNGVSVFVVGGGIGGLTAARECLRQGCSVRAFERHPGPVLSGDSFTIGTSALSSLRNYPRLQHEVQRMGVQPGLTVHKLDGTIIRGPVPLKDILASSVDPELLAETLRLPRPKLYQAMRDHLGRLGVEVEFGRDAVDYFEDTSSQRAGVILKDGSRHDADIVIAADGVSGHSWKLLLGKEVRARPSGDAIFRASFPAKRAKEDPIVFETYMESVQATGESMAHMYMGEIQVYIHTYPDRIEWGLVHKDDGRAQESWDHNPSLNDLFQLLEKYPTLPKEVKAIFSLTPPEKLLNWRIMWRDPQPKWTSAGGRVIQLGDAAHTFHPSSGNGGTQAMEDAVSLAQCLSIAGKDNLEWATRVHNLLRFERVSCLQAFGIANQAERVKLGSLPSIGRWMLSHDPELYARKRYHEALDHLQKGTAFKNTNIPPGMDYEPWTIETLLTADENNKPGVLTGDWA